jgi:hypothetical protein
VLCSLPPQTFNILQCKVSLDPLKPKSSYFIVKFPLFMEHIVNFIGKGGYFKDQRDVKIMLRMVLNQLGSDNVNWSKLFQDLIH